MAKDEINAFLGSGTTYQGKLNFQGSVRIDGGFTGEISSEGTLIVGKEAHVKGEVTVGQLVLSGKLEGEIVAAKKVVLHKTADLVGSVSTPLLVMEEGAKLEGGVTMNAKAKTIKSENKPELSSGFGFKGSDKTEKTGKGAESGSVAAGGESEATAASGAGSGLGLLGLDTEKGKEK